MVKKACKDMLITIKEAGPAIIIWYLMLFTFFSNLYMPIKGLIGVFTVIAVATRYGNVAAGLMRPMSDKEYKNYTFIKGIIASAVCVFILALLSAFEILVNHNEKLRDNIAVIVLLFMMLFLMGVDFTTCILDERKRSIIEKLSDAVLYLAIGEWIVISANYYSKDIPKLMKWLGYDTFIGELVYVALIVTSILLVCCIVCRYIKLEYYEYVDVNSTEPENELLHWFRSEK